jgi:hypothetical protein
LLEEREHKQQGEANSPDAGKVDAAVGVAAQIGAATSKKFAERL